MDKFIKIRQKTGRWETRNKMERRRSQNDVRMFVVYGMETGRRDFVGDPVSKDLTIRHRATTYTTNFKVKTARKTGIDRDMRIYVDSPVG
jgi:hypothetical protein